jgi:spoIIIJ-associated protein
MEWVEITDKTVEAATRRALDQLGVIEAEAEIVVVEEPKTGLFGRVRGEARVRARIRPTGPRPKRARRGRSGRDGRDGSRRPSESSSGGRNGGGQNGAGGANGSEGASSGSRASGSSGSRSRSRGRRGGGSRTPREGAVATVAVKEATTSSQREDEAMAEGMTLEEQGAIGKTFLEGLVGAFGLSATVDVRELDDETVELAVNGEDLGILVGPRGTTLAALQEVTRTAVQSKCPSRTDRILVDVARYRERRAKALTEFTQTLAAEVISTGEERQLEAMSPADRKVVHDAATDIEGVATRSEGEDPARFVVISPA